MVWAPGQMEYEVYYAVLLRTDRPKASTEYIYTNFGLKAWTLIAISPYQDERASWVWANFAGIGRSPLNRPSSPSLPISQLGKYLYK